MKFVRVSITLAALALTLAGCSSYSDYEPGYEDHIESQDDYQQSEEYLAAEGEDFAEQQRADDFAARGWDCFWDPTMNDDWHDDYMCSDGTSYDRPYLLSGDSFVERWEIDTAAADYEAMLNQ